MSSAPRPRWWMILSGGCVTMGRRWSNKRPCNLLKPRPMACSRPTFTSPPTNKPLFISAANGSRSIPPRWTAASPLIPTSTRPAPSSSPRCAKACGSPWVIMGFGSSRCSGPSSGAASSSSWPATSPARNPRARSSGKSPRKSGGKILVVAGPALVHTGAGEHFEKMIEWGYVDLLFAGNALAVHDIEHALYGTSLGVYLLGGALADEGHENHMRAINTIRAAGGITQAVAQGVLRQGIICQCVKHHVDFVLAGSVRDDGPLPEVITDMVAAQQMMRSKLGGVTIALMMGTMLHSIAVGNLLPAQVKTICVDINPSVVTKLTDRGTFQALGLVTDLEPFLRELTGFLAQEETPGEAPSSKLRAP